MLTFPNAKINIGLNIVEKRSDGFHNIESCFYPVQWCDVLEVLPNSETTAAALARAEIVFTSSGLAIPGEESSNLCIKALKLIQKNIVELNKIKPTENTSTTRLHLHKVIPMGAGLGGGSADGAFTLKAINEVYDLHYSKEDLKAFARQLGSDCAFFIENRPMYCYEKGDKFEEISLSLKGKVIVLVNPAVHISTAEAYSGVVPKPANFALKEALTLPIQQWKNTVVNDFEAKLSQKYPIIYEIKQQLYQMGALYASMTGSGSTVYGIFENSIDTKIQFKNFSVWQGELQ